MLTSALATQLLIEYFRPTEVRITQVFIHRCLGIGLEAAFLLEGELPSLDHFKQTHFGCSPALSLRYQLASFHSLTVLRS